MKPSAALLQEQIQSALGGRCEAAFRSSSKAENEGLPSAVGEIPRGAVTEIVGPASSGRTSLLFSLLAAASAAQEFCTVIDTNDVFDPASAAAAGVRLSQLLWVRCGGNAEHALKTADMLANGGGFGLIAIDLADVPAKTLQRISLNTWFRLRKAVEQTKTTLIVVGRKLQAQSCSALKIELTQCRALWRGQLSGCLLDGLGATARSTRNHRGQEHQFLIPR